MSWRKRAGAFLVDNGFRIASRVGRLNPRARAAFKQIENVRDIPYKASGNRAHLLDVYLPEGDGPFPIVFYVHGGGFRILSKDSHWIFGLIFARRGYAVFNVSYRLAPQHPFPAGLEDVVDAFDWVTDNAERFGCDPTRIVLAGESAGANLVTSLAVAQCFERPEPFANKAFANPAKEHVRAVIAMCGMYQVSESKQLEAHPFVKDRLEEITEAYLERDPAEPPLDEHALADPLLVLEGDEQPARPLPPFLLSVGTRDPLLPHTQRLSEALEGRGVPEYTHVYEGEPHAFQAFVFRKQCLTHWERTFDILDTIDGLQRKAG